MNVMLLTDMPPCSNYTAGIALNTMCDFLLDEGHNVSCYCVKNPYVNVRIPDDKAERMHIKIVDKPADNWGTRKPHLLKSIHGNWHTALKTLPGIAEDAVNFATQQKIDIVWAYIQGQNMIWLTRMLQKRIRSYFAVLIWDPPYWWMKENNVDPITKWLVVQSYGKMIAKSQCCLASSWSMIEHYNKKYHCQKIVMVNHSFPPERVLPLGSRNDDTFLIALSGQTYAENEICALIAALDILHWEYAGKRIHFRIYGILSDSPSLRHEHVEHMGFIEQALLLPILADADLLYCPYWFSTDYKEACTLSFPSKLSSYLKTGTPVFMHAPEYASPRRFLEKNHAGYICSSLVPEEIADVLRRIIDDPNRKDVGEQGYQVFLKYLTTDVMKRNLLIGLGLTDRE